MKKESLINAITELRKSENKKKFAQSFDLIINLKDLNLKNPEEQVDFFTSLKYSTSKIKVAALVGQELSDSAKICDKVIKQTEFDNYKDKKTAKKLATEYDFFIAQADIMPKVAQAFGRVLGTRGKMPNPKLGSILPGKAPVEPLYKKLQSTVRLTAKKTPVIQVKIGNENMKDEEIIENALIIYDQIIHHLPKERSNIKNAMLKLTMSKPIKIDI
ncbi:50S ribosomal protein L1 [Candidatus Woesearchaeota archaeon]|nr:50S ribosomal protein L1 [Candidatus Woesearchaeota archaeon]